MAEEKKPAAAAKKVESARGAWVVVDDAGLVLVVESSELKARRAAEPLKGRTILWIYGQTLEQAIS